MKRIFLVPIALAISALTGVAAPLCLDNQTYQSYIDLGAGGCMVGDQLFFNFGYAATSVGKATPTANDIVVVSKPNDVVAGPGLFFSSGSWNVFSGQTMDVTLTFSVSGPPTVLKDASLTSAGGVITGSGVGTVTETLKNGATPIPGSPLVVNAFGSGAASIDFVGAGGTLLSALNVSTLVHVHGNVPGIVSISTVEEHFSEAQQVGTAPEPVQALLIGSGFLLLGLKWRKSRR